MKLFIIFIILNLSSLTFIQAQTAEVLEAEAAIWKIDNNYTAATGIGIKKQQNKGLL